MKKFYLLSTLFLMSSWMLSQNLVLNGDLEAWDDANNPTDWTKVESIDQESTEVQEGTYSAKHTGGTKDLGQTISGIIAGTTYDLSLWYKVDAGFGDGTDARIWSYWKDASNGNVTDAASDGALRGPNNAYFDANGNVWTEYTATVVAPAGATQFYLEVRTYGSAVVYWDDFSLEAQSTTDPTLNITTPTNNQVLPLGTTDVDVTFVANNFVIGNPGDAGVEGHVHGTLDGTAIPMHYSTAPISLTGLAAGSHTVVLSLVDNSDAPLSPAVSSTVTFEIPTATNVADIATLRAGATDGTIYNLTGEAFINYAQSFRNQKWIQDATAGILIDDSAGNITAGVRDDGLSGIAGTLSTFNGMLQFVPIADATLVSPSTLTIAPQTVTLADLAANFEDYEAELVKVENVMLDTSVEANFVNGTNYPMTSGADSFDFFTGLFDVDYITTAINTSGYSSIVGLPFERESTPVMKFVARDLADMTVLSVEDINVLENTVQISNSVVQNSFRVILEGEATVEVYAMNGQLVKTAQGNNNIEVNISNAQTGTYIVRIFNGNDSVTKKVIKK